MVDWDALISFPPNVVPAERSLPEVTSAEIYEMKDAFEYA